MRICFIYFLLSLYLIQCTPYKKSGFMGGYNETWFSEREVKVHFSGNGYISSKRSADYTAFRVCELTLANGFSHFIIVDETSGGTTSIEQITPTRTEI